MPTRSAGVMLFEFVIFAKYFEVVDKRFHCIDRLLEAHIVGESEIDVESVFPFAAQNWQRLYFREVDVVESEYG